MRGFEIVGGGLCVHVTSAKGRAAGGLAAVASNLQPLAFSL